MTPERTQVAIIDDHLMFAESLARLLGDETDIAVVGVAGNGEEGRALLAREHVQVLVIDYHLPDIDGVSLAHELLGEHDALGVIVITGANDDQLMINAIQAGCAGFLTKDLAATEVADAVRSVAAGEAMISPQTLARLLPLIGRTDQPVGADLTNREHDLLERMANGLTNRAMADEMFLSTNTVRNYSQSILNKLGAHSKLEAVSIAVRHGIITYPQI